MAEFKLGRMTLKSLFSKPATKLYPIEKPHFFEQTKGRIHIEVDTCKYCGLCANVCPTGAISVDRKALTWEIDRFRCIQCRSCIEACREDALLMHNHYTDPADERVVEVYQATPEERARREKTAAEKAERAARLKAEMAAKKKAEAQAQAKAEGQGGAENQ